MNYSKPKCVPMPNAWRKNALVSWKQKLTKRKVERGKRKENSLNVDIWMIFFIKN